ncbi:DUF4394 domain-containing protein [Daejeonella sp.]|uniref:DUF4394 domain-containing protein n=1 Tax=Daejeonella sp. TaxID=2805397 RepID=UPI00398353B5
MVKSNLGKIGAIVLLTISMAACQKDDSLISADNANKISSTQFKSNNSDPQGITFFALSGNTLDKYSTSNPEDLLGSATITGLQSGERVLAIDFRPATAQLYALGSNSRLYTINPETGLATLVAPLTTIPMGTTTPVALTLMGTSFGFDFNPVVDRIRIVSNTGQNLRAHPTTGVTIIDRSINPQPAMVNGVAYDNNDNDPATPTELYALDPSKDLLYEINPPNAGTLVEPQNIKLKIEGDGGFDIAPRNANITTDIALGLYEVNKKSTLFRIDVETGVTKILAYYNKDIMYSAIAISPAL